MFSFCFPDFSSSSFPLSPFILISQENIAWRSTTQFVIHRQSPPPLQYSVIIINCPPPLLWSILLHSHSSSSSSSSSWTTKMLLGLVTTVKLPDQNCHSAIYINKIVALNILMVYGLMRGWMAWHVTSSLEQKLSWPARGRDSGRRNLYW